MSVDQPRLYIADDITFVRLQPNGASTIGSSQTFFQVPTPDARILTKISVVLYQEKSAFGGLAMPFDTTLNGIVQWGISAQAADKVTNGLYAPVTNLLGTPGPNGVQAFPFSTNAGDSRANLTGVSLDVQHGCDAVVGVIQMLLTGALAGTGGVTAALRVRWNLQGSEMCDAEWAYARQQMSVQVQAQSSFP